jgi:hypothetical protein
MTTLLERNERAITQASSAMRGTTQSVDRMGVSLHELEPSLDRVASLEEPLTAAAALGPPLQELSSLRAELAQVAALRESLSQVASLSRSLDRMTELEPALARLPALQDSLERMADVTAQAATLSDLREPLDRMAQIRPTLIALKGSIDNMEKLIEPLDSTSTTLARLLGLLDVSPWLIALGLTLWLSATLIAACGGTWLALWAFTQRRRTLARSGAALAHELASSVD